MSDKEFLAQLNAYLGGQEWRKGVAVPLFLSSDGSINRAKTLELVVFSDMDQQKKRDLLKCAS